MAMGAVPWQHLWCVFLTHSIERGHQFMRRINNAQGTVCFPEWADYNVNYFLFVLGCVCSLKLDSENPEGHQGVKAIHL